MRALALLSALAQTALAGPPDNVSLPTCGHAYFRPPQGPPPERACAPATARIYSPRYEGLAYEVLALESEACFVADESYRLLDRLMDEIHAEVDALGFVPGDQPTAATADRIGEITVDALVRNGFRLRIGTRTLGDALTQRNFGAQSYYPFDCDIGSLILLTVGQHYGVQGWLVETQLGRDVTHIYVRWALRGGEIVDWDTNARSPCQTRGEHASWQGRAWSRDEVLAYILVIRSGTFSAAHDYVAEIADLERAMELTPARPAAFYLYAWRVSTYYLEDRSAHAVRAHTAALHALNLERRPWTLNALACVLALRGDYARATEMERAALATVNSWDDASIRLFRERIRRFTASPPSDCTGTAGD